jgi:pyruvate/2-oxoglutarate dehydrogenase complex dihydrolipoamide dehydrogenase (E3) component
MASFAICEARCWRQKLWEDDDEEIKFRKALIATGGRPSLSNVAGLAEAPYTTNEILFNLQTLLERMTILGAGVIALEMEQCFASFGSHVTVIQRSKTLFASKRGDPEARGCNNCSRRA